MTKTPDQQRDYKLISDPFLRPGHRVIFRYDGISSQDRLPIQVCDPRKLKPSSSSCSFIGLPVPDYSVVNFPKHFVDSFSTSPMISFSPPPSLMNDFSQSVDELSRFVQNWHEPASKRCLKKDTSHNAKKRRRQDGNTSSTVSTPIDKQCSPLDNEPKESLDSRIAALLGDQQQTSQISSDSLMLNPIFTQGLMPPYFDPHRPPPPIPYIYTNQYNPLPLQCMPPANPTFFFNNTEGYQQMAPMYIPPPIPSQIVHYPEEIPIQQMPCSENIRKIVLHLLDDELKMIVRKHLSRQVLSGVAFKCLDNWYESNDTKNKIIQGGKYLKNNSWPSKRKTEVEDKHTNGPLLSSTIDNPRSYRPIPKFRQCLKKSSAEFKNKDANLFINSESRNRKTEKDPRSKIELNHVKTEKEESVIDCTAKTERERTTKPERHKIERDKSRVERTKIERTIKIKREPIIETRSKHLDNKKSSLKFQKSKELNCVFKDHTTEKVDNESSQTTTKESEQESRPEVIENSNEIKLEPIDELKDPKNQNDENINETVALDKSANHHIIRNHTKQSDEADHKIFAELSNREFNLRILCSNLCQLFEIDNTTSFVQSIIETEPKLKTKFPKSFDTVVETLQDDHHLEVLNEDEEVESETTRNSFCSDFDELLSTCSTSAAVNQTELCTRSSRRRSYVSKYRIRTAEGERQNTHSYLIEGIDCEDIRFLKVAYHEIMRGVAIPDWLRKTHWVDHPPTRLEYSDEDCARCIGYDMISLSKNNVQYGPPAAKFSPTSEENRSRKEVNSRCVGRREFRSMQRRLMANIGDTDFAEIFRFSQLKLRKKRLQFGKSRIHDWGLFSCEHIAAEEMVIEYVGETIRQTVADKREHRQTVQTSSASSYLFRIDSDIIIDATHCGNLARFINHSCDPNCYAKIINVDQCKKVVIYSKREILRGEEITYDYKFPLEDKKIPCCCGSPNCRKTLN